MKPCNQMIYLIVLVMLLVIFFLAQATPVGNSDAKRLSSDKNSQRIGASIASIAASFDRIANSIDTIRILMVVVFLFLFLLIILIFSCGICGIHLCDIGCGINSGLDDIARAIRR
ncbi:unnamed protein product [Rotaria sordida]|uniref:Uncharacterized protein n=1 Tax=Rotaria sordida TaxID=392033 RepID=A0A818VH31_9BILA|nr:unnamed protein product [Rotaria sordida]